MKHNVCNKFVRICYNTYGWKFPSGDARRLETKSHASQNGYGSEEWLFRYEWMLSGYEGDETAYHYAFVQPLQKFRDSYEDNEISILLWTIDERGRRWIVGKIDHVYIPPTDEIEWAQEQYKKNGWLRTMRNELKALDVDTTYFTEPSINIRFRQEDVTLFDPWIDVTSTNLTIAQNSRYHPYDYGSDDLKLVLNLNVSEDESDATRSEKKRTRKGFGGTTYDPRHVQIQNLLYKTLRDRHGKKAMKYEDDFVDLKIDLPGHMTFIEIKTASTAKRCIREALGQVLEYSCYSNKQLADELLVVGEAAPNDEDKKYLIHLRKHFKLPLYYSQFLWEKSDLDEKY
ncbi:hypothetical protein AWB71_01332 [Caballeronia peredens]|nr:hypothetical protein AWB71_01332 [Caballeronia peredens]